VTLTVSKGYERLTEIGIKKTAGASKVNIFNQFIYESLLISLSAMMLAVLLGALLAPFFSNILGKDIDIFQLLSRPTVLLVGLSVFLLIGFISGLYPALVISGISPIQIINQQGGLKRKNSRAGIIAVQFCITIVLITSLIIINRQITFIKNKDMGFDQELMVKLNLNGGSSQKWEILKNKLLSNPSVISVTASHGVPMAIYGTAGGRITDAENKKVENVKDINIDDDFIQTFGLTLIAGRNIAASDSNVCLINEQLYNELEWDNFEGKKVFESSVVGIVKDFNYLDLRSKIGYLRLRKLNGNPTDLSIKISGNIAQNLEFIQHQFHEIEPGAPFSYRFYDDWVQSRYQQQEDQAYAVKLFAILAIIISCLGLVGLAKNVTNKKVKEIGIRKVNGAKISEILTMLNKDLVKWVTIAFIIATPIAWFAMNKWLENFAYKTEMSWWIFALAGLLALGIALLTVSWQSWRAATRNPVEALRYE
jgi:putative ABC transport system permease protein